MALLDPQSEANLDRVVAASRAAFGADLVSVVLFGSAAGSDFIRGRSDLNLAIVLERVTQAHLQALAAMLPQWRKWNLAMPLFVDREFLAHAGDVFAIEMRDIQSEHRVLFGADVFASIAVRDEDLRHQLEYEARAKLLRLRLQYADAGGDPQRVLALMEQSAPAFVVLLRAALRLVERISVQAISESLAACERSLGLRLRTLRRIIERRRAPQSTAGASDIEFAAYAAEIEEFVRFVDRLCTRSLEADV